MIFFLKNLLSLIISSFFHEKGGGGANKRGSDKCKKYGTFCLNTHKRVSFAYKHDNYRSNHTIQTIPLSSRIIDLFLHRTKRRLICAYKYNCDLYNDNYKTKAVSSDFITCIQELSSDRLIYIKSLGSMLILRHVQ